jgi:hypothetical protein
MERACPPPHRTARSYPNLTDPLLEMSGRRTAPRHMAGKAMAFLQRRPHNRDDDADDRSQQSVRYAFRHHCGYIFMRRGKASHQKRHRSHQ